MAVAGHEDPDGPGATATGTRGSVAKVNPPSAEAPPGREHQKGPEEVTGLNEPTVSGKPCGHRQVPVASPSKPAIIGPNQPAAVASLKQPAAVIGLNKSCSPGKPTSRPGSSSDQSKAATARTKQSKWLNQRVVVSCLEGHCDVVSSLDSNGDVLMTGR